MKTVEEIAMDSLTIKHGRMKDVDCNLFSIVNNERYFMPAFFDHYRAIGVQQFLILDDGSDDGTVEFLKDQSDCVILGSTLSFGEMIVDYFSEERPKKLKRAGTKLKNAIPKKYLFGKLSIYADADEFLILPSFILNIPDLFAKLSDMKITCVAASLIEFYPEEVSEWLNRKRPESFGELIARYPYFDAHPLLNQQTGCQPKRIAHSASHRLFKTYNIKKVPDRFSWLPEWISSRLPFKVFDSAVLKTPIVEYSDEVNRVGSHRANVPPSPDICLAFMHFKFTSDFARRIEQAIKKKSHFKGSEKYFRYSRLVRIMTKLNGSFLGPLSCMYTGPECLEEAGLIKWNFIKRTDQYKTAD